MNQVDFDARLARLRDRQAAIVNEPNAVDETWDAGWYERFVRPAVTPGHVPVEWRYDLDRETNPRLLERLGVNATFNTGAIERDGKVLLVLRTEGLDRKSFFAVAESESGVDGFRFWDEPVVMPETDDPDANVYDMRLTAHEDGHLYGLFCTERKDKNDPDLSAAVAQCGICRTRDMRTWERLPDLRTPSPQQRNVVLHPEFVDGKYALYTRPQDSFISAGSGGGIGWATCDSMEEAVVTEERVIEPRAYHTFKEAKNGQGPPPIKTDAGWLHLAHGVRPTATGLRYVCYLFMTALDDPSRVTHAPGQTFIAPRGRECMGDLWSVAFSNGWVRRADGTVLIYYATNDTLTWVARSDVGTLVDFCVNTPPDAGRSAACVEQRLGLIRRNRDVGTA